MEKKEQKLEDIYQKKTQIEHILLRPDSYIGSVELSDADMWIQPNNQDKMIFKSIQYAPGLYKIFDEILVNAADNFQRSPDTNKIEVNLDQQTGMITVKNNGKGIPVVIHKKEKVFIPELIFGQLLTGSNFNDDQKKITGGRNGYGAKLTNIYSTIFKLECADSKNNKILKTTWRNNMSHQDETEIIKKKIKKDYTQVSFIPDYKRFQLDGLTPDILALFRKRVYDIAGVLNGKVQVYLNGEKILIKSFQNYVDYYLKDPQKIQKIHFKTQRWEIVLVPSDGTFDQVSFVNAICTVKGGTHVNYVVTQLMNSLQTEINKKFPKLVNFLKPYMIKNQFQLFLNCLIENPAFDSQTKENLTSRQNKFGSKCELSKQFLKQVISSDIIEKIIYQAEMREQKELQKKFKGVKKTRLTGIEKLEDANQAGKSQSQQCLLVLTEGDSAKALAMAGLEIVGRDLYGVFPLKGKLLNVRDANSAKILKNKEIQNLINIIGLKVGQKYDELKSLRYGGIMIMTDQDVDGSHIKGLLINMFAFFWPSLIENFTFIRQFITPIIKCFKKNQTLSFFTIKDYKNWAQDVNIKLWRIKYYKGLGTSTDEEGREYFENIQRHQIDFKHQDQEDFDKIDLLFNKARADERKDWLKNYDEENIIDSNQKQVTYKEFIDKEMIHFSMYDNQRSIPNIVDGLKPGQRKILYACFIKNLVKEMKVAQLTGLVASISAYHHGEQSLHQTIIGLAQNFVGSNNINLLMPNGQFGSRSMGGKDSASARYIHTKLNHITRFIFQEDDDHLLNYLIDDGDLVEPRYYVPILPMVLVNGAEGIGTGWSTHIPNFSPREIVKNLLRKIDGNDFQRMIPNYKNFNGEIIATDKGYETYGKFNLEENNLQLNITELPIGSWTRKYKTFLEDLINKELIRDFNEYHTSSSVDFQIQLNEDKLKIYKNKKFVIEKMKLRSNISSQNYVLFDKNCQLKRYSNELEIMEEFYHLRLEFYERRKIYLLSKIERELVFLDNKLKFIIYNIEEKIVLRNRKKKNIIENLIRLGFVKEKDLPQIQSTKIQAKKNELVVQQLDDDKKDDETDITIIIEDQTLESDLKEFNYLLRMPVISFSQEEVEKIKKKIQEKKDEKIILENYQIKDMWKDDLNKFLEILDDIESQEELKRLKAEAKQKKIKNGKKNKKKKYKKRKKSNEDKKPKQRKKKNKKIQKEQTEMNLNDLQKKNYDDLTLEEQLFLLKNKEENNQSSSYHLQQQQNKQMITSKRKQIQDFSDSDYLQQFIYQYLFFQFINQIQIISYKFLNY